MAAIPLFRDTNMADVTSRENTVYVWVNVSVFFSGFIWWLRVYLRSQKSSAHDFSTGRFSYLCILGEYMSGIHNPEKFDLQRHAVHQFQYYLFLERLLLVVD